MDLPAFERRGRALDEFARQRPFVYRMALSALCLTGYGYVLLLLTLFAGATVAIPYLCYRYNLRSVGAPFTAAAAAIAWAVLRSLFVRAPQPEGRYVTAEEAPALFEVIEDVRRAMGARRVHGVIVSFEVNAAVRELPAFGLYGPRRRYLCVGLPLLWALDERQARAVLAHEMAHFRRGHWRISSWVYSIESTYRAALQRLSERHGCSSGLFRLPGAVLLAALDWLGGPLLRQHEYEADRLAAETAGAVALASGLLAIGRAVPVMEELWGGATDTLGDEPEPPKDLILSLRGAMCDVRCTEADADWVRSVADEPSSFTSTHPTLGDRLEALGGIEAAAAYEPDGRSAAEVLLETADALIAAEFEYSTAEGLRALWDAAHVPQAEGKQRLADLEARASEGPLGVDEAWERASLTAGFKGLQHAAPLCRDVLALDADHVSANAALGTALLAAGDEQGLDHLRKAVRGEPEEAVAALHMMEAFLEGHDRGREADECRRQRIELESQVRANEHERSGAWLLEKYVAPDLRDETLAAIRAACSAQPRVLRAHLARKVMGGRVEPPMYVLCANVSVGYFKTERRARQMKQEAAAALTAALADVPYSIYVYVPGARAGEAGEGRIRKCGVRVYERPKTTAGS